MADQDRIRVIRIVEYVGPRDWVEPQVARSLHGTIIRESNPMGVRWPEGAAITAVTIGEFGESIADSDSPEWVAGGVVEVDGTRRITYRNPAYFSRRGPTKCVMCGRENIHARKVRRWAPNGVSEVFLVCERCEEGMISTLPGYDQTNPEVVPFAKREGLE